MTEDVSGTHSDGEPGLGYREAGWIAVQAVPALVSFVGRDLRYKFANEGYAAWFGESHADAVIGRTLPEVLGDEAFATIRPFVERALAGEVVRFEGPVPYRRRGTRIVELAYIPHRAADGSVDGYVAHVQDVTISRLTERELRDVAARETALRNDAERARRYLETVLGSIKDLFVAVDRDWRVTIANEAAFRASGLDRARFIGRSIWDLGPWRGGAELEEALRRAMRQGTPLRLETWSPGRERWFEYRAYPMEDGLALLIADVTRRKRAEETLRENEELQRLAAEVARIGVWSWEPATGKVTWSAATSELLGVDDQVEPSLESFFARVHPEDRADFREEIRRLAEQGGDLDRVWRCVLPDGRVRWLQSLGRAFAIGPPEKHKFLGVVADVTARKRHEQELEDADRRKNEFLAMLAHELRNPLAPIANAAAVLRRSPPAEVAQRSIDAIDRQVRHLSRIVEDLLEVSRITRGQITLRRRRIDLADVVREIEDDAREVIRGAGLALEVHVGPGPLWIDADRTRVTQVLWNLVGNARKFTPQGGRIEIHARRTNGRVELRVRDTGIGIERSELSRIFEPFTQAPSARRGTDGSPGGLGLGLALVHRLVEMHGGRVSAHSEGLGTGAEFRAEFPPAAETGPKVERPDVPEPAIGDARKRILVIEDNVDVADTMRDLLELEGHEVRVVYSGAHAHEAIRTFHPEIVLCDLGLPDKDGLAVARELRTDPATADIRLIAVTGYGSPEDRRRAADAGFDAHLAKPVAASTLLDAIGSRGTPADIGA